MHLCITLLALDFFSDVHMHLIINRELINHSSHVSELEELFVILMEFFLFLCVTLLVLQVFA